MGKENDCRCRHSALALERDSNPHYQRDARSVCGAERGCRSSFNLEALLTATHESAMQQLSRLRTKRESASEGVSLDSAYLPAGHVAYEGELDPNSIWEEQLANLDLSAVKYFPDPGGNRTLQTSLGVPRLSEMIRPRRRVYVELAAMVKKEKLVAEGELLFADGKSVLGVDEARATAIHHAFIGFVHDVEYFAESNAEILAMEGVTDRLRIQMRTIV